MIAMVLVSSIITVIGLYWAFKNIGMDYFVRRHVLTELGITAGLFLTLGGTATGNLTAAISTALFSFTVGRVLAKRRRKKNEGLKK